MGCTHLRIRSLTSGIFLLGQMTLLSMVLSIALVRGTLLALLLQHIMKPGLKRLVPGSLAQVMTHFSSLSLLMGQGNAHFACKFFLKLFPYFCRQFSQKNFVQVVSPSKYTTRRTPLHQALFVVICSTTMQRGGFGTVKSRTLLWGVRRGKQLWQRLLEFLWTTRLRHRSPILKTIF